jgi:hypothetical protein
MLRKKDAASLDPWIDGAKNSLIAFFVRGAMEDKAAVRADIDSPWANRQAEGQIAKLKLVKRQMHGRGKIDLLQAQLLRAPSAQSAAIEIASMPGLESDLQARGRAARIPRWTTIRASGYSLAARTIRAQAMASERASWWLRAIPSFRQTSDSLVGRMFQARRAIWTVHRNGNDGTDMP